MRKDHLSYGIGLLLVGLVFGQSPAAGSHSADDPVQLIKVEICVEHEHIQAGWPVWAQFSLTNLTADTIVLQVPDTQVDDPQSVEMGLPLSHVFSGERFSALAIEDLDRKGVDTKTFAKPKDPLPIIRLAPQASIGIRIELTGYYESLRRPGKYKIIWRPYHGVVESAPLLLNIKTERQASIVTDFGTMIMRFYYAQAPKHVENFVELVEQQFYGNLMFHRVIPGGLIQGGDPRGDGQGIRPDGKRLKAEFSNIPFNRGTVGMARSRYDPDSGSCQFFICVGKQPSFDGNQTAFGYLVGEQSFETLDRIAKVTTGPKDRPEKAVYIRAISLENVPLRERGAATRPAAVGGRTKAKPMPKKGKKSAIIGLSAVRKSGATTRPTQGAN